MKMSMLVRRLQGFGAEGEAQKPAEALTERLQG